MWTWAEAGGGAKHSVHASEVQASARKANGTPADLFSTGFSTGFIARPAWGCRDRMSIDIFEGAIFEGRLDDETPGGDSGSRVGGRKCPSSVRRFLSRQHFQRYEDDSIRWTISYTSASALSSKAGSFPPA